MMNKIKIILLSLITLFFLAAATPPANAFNLFSNCASVTNSDGTTTQVCGPCKDNPKAPGCSTQSKGNPLVSLINDAAGIIALITGAGAVIMIIIGAIAMTSSGGNAEAVTNARRRILYSLVGLIVVALAWTITRFITDRLVQ